MQINLQFLYISVPSTVGTMVTRTELSFSREDS